MANPLTYVPSYSFRGYQETNSRSPLPADEVDSQLFDISSAIANHRAALMNIRRSDGALKNALVTYDSLSGDVKARLANVSSTTEEQLAAIYDYVVEELVGSVIPFKTVTAADALQDAIEEGGELWVGAGEYNITAMIDCTLSQDTTIHFAPGARIVAASTILTQLFRIDGGGVHTLDIDGGHFDASTVSVTNPSGDKGSIWDLNRLKSGSVRNGIYLAGTDWEDQKGDTAVDTISCGPMIFDGNKCYGWSDNAFYLSGANDLGAGDDGGPSMITNNYFSRCSTGVAVKRKNRDVVVTGNTFDRCYIGMGAYEVSAGEIQPGHSFVITGNLFRDNVFAAIENRGGRGEVTFTGNRIVDFGYGLDNVAIADASAIKLRGSRRCVVSGNYIGLSERAKTSAHIGVLVDNITIAGEAYVAGDNLISDNTFDSVRYTVYEGAGVDPTTCLNNMDVNGTDTFLFTNDASQWSGIIGSGGDFRHYTGVKEMLRIHDGGARFKPNASTAGLTFIACLKGQTLGFGTVANGDSSPLVEVDIPGVTGSDIAIVQAETSTAFNPAITYTPRCATGKAQVYARNLSGGPIDFDDESFCIYIFRCG